MRHEHSDPEKMALIRTLPAFASASKAEVRRLAAALDIVDVAAGTVLATEGRPQRDVVVVVAGDAARTNGGRFAGVAGPGDLLGRDAARRDAVHDCTVLASTPMRLLVAAGTSAHDVLELIRPAAAAPARTTIPAEAAAPLLATT
jgi:CRP-like cAMP-binding protein